MIPHELRLALAAAELAIAIRVIGSALGRPLVPSSRGSLLRHPRQNATAPATIALAAIATSAQREQLEAEPASLEPEQLVDHRSQRRRELALDVEREHRARVDVIRRPSARGSRRQPSPQSFFGIVVGTLTARSLAPRLSCRSATHPERRDRRGRDVVADRRAADLQRDQAAVNRTRTRSPISHDGTE
jgi:hypothetical protein